ncbi:MAG: site-specific integrase [Defluviitaleaceae bacterium]|nr:site-specific integrase [Defluviitaleaceae bacterium]
MATHRERNGKYQIRVSLGYDIHGRQKVKAMTWIPDTGMTQKQIDKELERQKFLFEEKCKGGLVVDGNIKFAVYAEKWLSLGEEHLAPKTYLRYQSLLSRINAAMGHIKLCDMRPHHLQEFYKNLAETGINKRTGKGLSGKTILHHHRLISVILGDAYKQEYILRDISTLVTPPKATQKEVSYLDEQDAQKLCNALLNVPPKWKTALLLLLYTGIRRGELVGLEWSDIDFEGKTITIRRTVQYITGEKYHWKDEFDVLHKGQLIEKKPKTKSSERCIAVDNGVIGLIVEYRRWWEEQKTNNGHRWISTEKLFIQDNGGVMHPDSITDYTNKFFKKHDLPKFSPHSLRHTNISLMIAAGVDIKSVSSRAGHSNVTTTGNIYIHQIQSANARAAEAIAGIFNNQTDDKKP